MHLKCDSHSWLVKLLLRIRQAKCCSVYDTAIIPQNYSVIIMLCVQSKSRLPIPLPNIIYLHCTCQITWRLGPLEEGHQAHMLCISVPLAPVSSFFNMYYLHQLVCVITHISLYLHYCFKWSNQYIDEGYSQPAQGVALPFIQIGSKVYLALEHSVIPLHWRGSVSLSALPSFLGTPLSCWHDPCLPILAVLKAYPNCFSFLSLWQQLNCNLTLLQSRTKEKPPNFVNCNIMSVLVRSIRHISKVR